MSPRRPYSLELALKLRAADHEPDLQLGALVAESSSVIVLIDVGYHRHLPQRDVRRAAASCPILEGEFMPAVV